MNLIDNLVSVLFNGLNMVSDVVAGGHDGGGVDSDGGSVMDGNSGGGIGSYSGGYSSQRGMDGSHGGGGIGSHTVGSQKTCRGSHSHGQHGSENDLQIHLQCKKLAAYIQKTLFV